MSVVVVRREPFATSLPSVGRVADVVLIPALLAVVVVLVKFQFTLPSTSQSPAVREMLVTLAVVTVVRLTALPVATRELTTSPTLPADALPTAVVPTMLGVLMVGDVPNTAKPVPVSSDSTPSNCADVVAANTDKLLLVYATVPPPPKATELESVPVKVSVLLNVTVLLAAVTSAEEFPSVRVPADVVVITNPFRISERLAFLLLPVPPVEGC